MTSTGAAVRVRGLRKIYRLARYREVAALNGLDLDVGAGEIVALLGPNGAGKTTAVQILTAGRRRDAGEVTVLGTDPAAAGRAWRPARPPVSFRVLLFANPPGAMNPAGRLIPNYSGQNVIVCLSDG